MPITQQQLADLKRFRSEAVADGWTTEPTYRNESIERATTLRREGFVMQVIARPSERRDGLAIGSIHIWGPDELAVNVPPSYSWALIKANADTCMSCGGPGATHRYSFAGRCCARCLPAMQAKHERAGWSD